MLNGLRRLPTLLRLWRAAKVEAEALAWHHGSRGVEIAEARAAAANGLGDRDEATYRGMVWRLARGRHRELAGADTATRRTIGEEWARRPGQMIRS